VIKVDAVLGGSYSAHRHKLGAKVVNLAAAQIMFPTNRLYLLTSQHSIIRFISQLHMIRLLYFKSSHSLSIVIALSARWTLISSRHFISIE